MRRRVAGVVAGWVCTGILASGATCPRTNTAERLVAKDLVGEWRLRDVGGQDPSAVDVKSLAIDIGADGRWTGRLQMMRGRLIGMRLVYGGTWTLGDGVVRFAQTSPSTGGYTTGWLEDGRLTIDPDLIVRTDGWTAPASCAYERTRGPSR